MTKTTKLLFVLTIVSLISTAIIYQWLPATIPTHFGLDGQPDQYSEKQYVFILGALPILITLAMAWLPKFDPKRDNYAKFSTAYEILKVVIVVFLMIVQWLMIMHALGYVKDISTAMMVILSFLFIILGNYMPKFKHNYFVGIKTPWTLANPVSWQKTHRLGGYLFMTTGVLSMIGLAISPQVAGVILVGGVLLATLIATIYSYFIFKANTDNQ